jgi:hypothetical protein
MTTKTPSAVKPAPAKSLETIAYASVSSIPTAEPHDRDRLGYNVWRWLTSRRDSLEIALKTSRIRLLISEAEALERVRKSLRQQGVDL